MIFRPMISPVNYYAIFNGIYMLIRAIPEQILFYIVILGLHLIITGMFIKVAEE